MFEVRCWWIAAVMVEVVVKGGSPGSAEVTPRTRTEPLIPASTTRFPEAVNGFRATTQAGEEEITIGRNAALQLKVQIDLAQPLALPVSVFPGITGYATGLVGLHSAALDDPANDFYTLSSAADLRFVLLSNAPGLEVWNDRGSAYMKPGEDFMVGPPIFDLHPVWNLVSAKPGQSYALTLLMKDLGGVYADSDPFVLSFTPQPPVLTILPAGPGFATLSWAPAAPGLLLQVAKGLEPSAWTNAPSQGAPPITLPTSDGLQFFRVIR